jgi:hypothetical protein
MEYIKGDRVTLVRGSGLYRRGARAVTILGQDWSDLHRYEISIDVAPWLTRVTVDECDLAPGMVPGGPAQPVR